jgi:LysR family glycine cleavage system transcriptional activator
MIQAAITGQGVALGRQPLVNELIQSGMLVVPFKQAIVGARAHFIIESSAAVSKPHVRQFAAWLLEEAKTDSEREGHG